LFLQAHGRKNHGGIARDKDADNHMNIARLRKVEAALAELQAVKKRAAIPSQMIWTNDKTPEEIERIVDERRRQFAEAGISEYAFFYLYKIREDRIGEDH
jgi:mRNA degradation ribonuclease J1/J2